METCIGYYNQPQPQNFLEYLISTQQTRQG